MRYDFNPIAAAFQGEVAQDSDDCCGAAVHDQVTHRIRQSCLPDQRDTIDCGSPLGILTHDAVGEILIKFPEHTQCSCQTERKKRRQNRCQIQSFDAALLQIGDDGKSKHREQSGTQGMLEGIPFGNRVIEPAKTAQQERQIEKHGIDEGDSLR